MGVLKTPPSWIKGACFKGEKRGREGREGDGLNSRQILWLGSKHLVSDIAVTQVPVLTLSLTVADSARDLGVVIDSCLTMADHVSANCRSDHFQLCQLRPVTQSLTADAAKTIVHDFICM